MNEFSKPTNPNADDVIGDLVWFVTRPLSSNAFWKCGSVRTATVCVCVGPMRVFNLHKSDKNRMTGGKAQNNEWGTFSRLVLIWSKLVMPLGFECCTPHRIVPNHTTKAMTTEKKRLMISFDAVPAYGSAAHICILLVNRTEHTHTSVHLLCSVTRLLSFGDVA